MLGWAAGGWTMRDISYGVYGSPRWRAQALTVIILTWHSVFVPGCVRVSSSCAGYLSTRRSTSYTALLLVLALAPAAALSTSPFSS